jgi:hypothetical protein
MELVPGTTSSQLPSRGCAPKTISNSPSASAARSAALIDPACCLPANSPKLRKSGFPRLPLMR